MNTRRSNVLAVMYDTEFYLFYKKQEIGTH